MNHPIHRVALLIALLTLVLTVPSALAHVATAHTQPARASELASVIDHAMTGTQVPALGALVIRDGRIAEYAVRGVRSNKSAQRALPDDAWLIGSTGKPMTVALIARLVDRGVLSWDTPLSALLPAQAGTMQPAYRSMTLVQLLSHRAGLPENLGNAAALDAYFVDTRPLPEQRAALIDAALREAPKIAPGTAFAYSNTGFIIAALVAERATGKPFETLMQDEVFNPLGMTTAGFGPTPNDRLLGHRNGAPAGPVRKSDDGVPMVYTAAGNLHMSLRDWARFCMDQLAGARGHGALLSPASYRLMQTAQPGSPSGLDWGVQASIADRSGPVFVHGGSDGNWLAWVALFPQANSGVLVIANAAEDMGADQATHAVMGALFASVAPAKKITPHAPVKRTHRGTKAH